MSLYLPLPENPVRQYRLSQGEPPVVGRHPPVPVDLEPFLLQQSYYLLQEEQVLERPPGECNRAHSPHLTDPLATRDDHLGHRPVERGGDLRRRSSGQQILDDRAQDPPGLHDPAVLLRPQPERIPMTRRTLCNQLQLHCRLPLVSGPPGSRHPNQRRYGVEEPTRAGRRWSVQPPL